MCGRQGRRAAPRVYTRGVGALPRAAAVGAGLVDTVRDFLLAHKALRHVAQRFRAGLNDQAATEAAKLQQILVASEEMALEAPAVDGVAGSCSSYGKTVGKP